MKSGSKVRNVEDPTKDFWRIHITDAESKDREENSNNWPSENCDLELEILLFTLFILINTINLVRIGK